MVEWVQIDISRQLACQCPYGDSHIGLPICFKGINEGIPNLEQSFIGDCPTNFRLQYPVVYVWIILGYITLKNIHFLPALIRRRLCAAKESLQSFNCLVRSLALPASIAVMDKLLLKKMVYHSMQGVVNNPVAESRSVYRPSFHLFDTLKLKIRLKVQTAVFQIFEYLEYPPFCQLHRAQHRGAFCSPASRFKE